MKIRIYSNPVLNKNPMYPLMGYPLIEYLRTRKSSSFWKIEADPIFERSPKSSLYVRFDGGFRVVEKGVAR